MGAFKIDSIESRIRKAAIALRPTFKAGRDQLIGRTFESDERFLIWIAKRHLNHLKVFNLTSATDNQVVEATLEALSSAAHQDHYLKYEHDWT